MFYLDTNDNAKHTEEIIGEEIIEAKIIWEWVQEEGLLKKKIYYTSCVTSFYSSYYYRTSLYGYACAVCWETNLASGTA